MATKASDEAENGGGDEGTTDLRVLAVTAILPPSCVFEELPGSHEIYASIVDAREVVLDTLAARSDRMLVVLRATGKAEKIVALARDVAALSSTLDEHLLLMIEPRLELAHDDADGGAADDGHLLEINRWLRETRELLLRINTLGVPTALEFEDTITPQFFCDLLSWASVSAQSETLRELVSGLSMPVGLACAADRSGWAIEALGECKSGHHFLGVAAEGLCGIVHSTGNADAHIVLSASVGASAKPTAEDGAAALGVALKAVEGHARPRLVLDLDEAGPGSASALGAALLSLLKSDSSRAPAVRGVRLHVAEGLTGGLRELLVALSGAVQARGVAARQMRAGKSASNLSSVESDNLRIKNVRALLPPACLVEELPPLSAHAGVVRAARAEAAAILRGESDRAIVLAGPAGVDNPRAAAEYAARLAALSAEVRGEVLLIMRVGLNAGGHGGLLKDPARDRSYAINRGLREARELLLQVRPAMACVRVPWSAHVAVSARAAVRTMPTRTHSRDLLL